MSIKRREMHTSKNCHVPCLVCYEESFDEAVDYLQEDEEIQAGFEEDIV